MVDTPFLQEPFKDSLELVPRVSIYAIWNACVAHNLLESLSHRLLVLELEGLCEDDSREDVLNNQDVLERLVLVLGVRGRT